MSRLKVLFSAAAATALLVTGFGAAGPASASPGSASTPLSPGGAVLTPVGDITADATGIAAGLAEVWDPAAGETVSAAPGAADQILQEYWTPARIAAAKEVEAPLTEHTEALPEAADFVLGRETTLSEPAAAQLSSAGIQSESHFSVTNGKVFYRNPATGLDYACSGGSVNSDSRRVVVTAGHCVHPGTGSAWMQNWIYIPGYQNGNEPHGRFSAYAFYSSTGWTQDADYRRDLAFVVTETNASGQRVVDAAGGHGLTTNPGRPYVHIAGYPGNRDNGEVQWNCWGNTSPWSASDNGQKLRCHFGGGSSGSPWLRDFGANGLGYVISNMQGVNVDGDNYGPYYDNHVRDIFNNARNVTP